MSLKRKQKPLLHSTELSAHITMEGDLVTDNSLLIKGSYSGSIASSSHITIDREAIVEPCKLAAKSLSISGRFGGEIKAETFVEICDRANVSAIIETPNISIAETSHFEGHIRMPGIGN
ncbi:MAG TPA: polymer-forming cytoskeletal protein [Rectinemataceae bacterium]|nr:polymer-forming cytoskeletal protein [Rectinemataceae bacterium]